MRDNKIKMSTKRNILDYFSYFVLLIAFGMMLYYAYMSYYPFEIIRFTNKDENGNGLYKILTPEVGRGDAIRYVSDFEKLMPIAGEMSCYFEDGIVYQLNERTNNNSVGNHDEIRQVDVPLSLQPEVYRYGCTVRYKLTMGRAIEYKFYTEPFTIIE